MRDTVPDFDGVGDPERVGEGEREGLRDDVLVKDGVRVSDGVTDGVSLVVSVGDGELLCCRAGTTSRRRRSRVPREGAISFLSECRVTTAR